MEQLHRKKLYALIAAAIAFISLLLPWASISLFGMSQSWNGFRSWGYLSLIGSLAVIGFTLASDKTEDYTGDFKTYTMFSFIAIALGAFIFVLRKISAAGEGFINVPTGIGLWLCLLAGIGGVALLYGLIKIDTKKPA
jgi:hypothetical protein